MTTRDIRNLPKDLDRQISKDFNALIKKVHAQLSTKKRSPVYTGFFASSWKAQSSPVRPTDRIEKFQPWISIKRNHDLPVGGAPWKEKGSKPSNPVIKPRFPVKRAFNYKKPVYIGNKVKYAVYALEGGKVQQFIQGSLGKMIRETMTDKGLPKGKLFVQGGITGGFGSVSSGIGYTQF
tara:strand:+ start:38 stop:574 length:537 start_codon:yes stop_codon:yes gene_type:complete